MTRYLLAATALATGLAAIATPAAARDRSAYFGLEAGALFVKDTDVDIDEQFDDDFSIDHKMGIDGDMIAGYDFGMFRAEAELGYKRSEHDEYEDSESSFDADGRSSVYSLMGNVMIDVGQDEGVSFFAGVGAGYAQVTHVLEENGEGALKIQDRGFAWQAIAAYAPWCHNISTSDSSIATSMPATSATATRESISTPTISRTRCSSA